MSNTSVKIPDLETMLEKIKQAEFKNDLFQYIMIWMNMYFDGTVTLSQLSTVNEYYKLAAAKEEWRNVRNNKAGYVPMRRAATAIAHLIHKQP